jgi:hypothetical protein
MNKPLPQKLVVLLYMDFAYIDTDAVSQAMIHLISDKKKTNKNNANVVNLICWAHHSRT